MKWRSCFLLAIAVSFLQLIGNAQLTTGIITGTVTDQSGAAVPGTTITVKNVDTGISRTTVTGSSGRYEMLNLPVGSYEVSGTMAGFQTVIRKGIELTVGRTAVVDLALQVGEVSQALTVTGEASLVETTTATVSQLVDEKRVEELPLNNRDLTQLTFLQPGVVRSPAGASDSTGFGAKLTVAGSRGGQNLYLVDGVSNADFTGNSQGASGSYIGAETVQEFQIITNNYSAEYQSTPGGIISAVTKSGTNSLHGSLFEFIRNDNVDAATWENNAFGGKKPEFKRNQFGGSVGGPVIKDRTFFFGSYEGLRERLGTTSVVLVPTIQARQGILPTRTVTVAPQVKPYLDLWPVPGQGNTVVKDIGDGTIQIAGAGRQPTNDDFMAVKMDHRFTQEKLGFLSGTYNFDKSNRDVGTLMGGANDIGSAARKQVVSARLSSPLSSTTLNEFIFGYSSATDTGSLPVTARDFSSLAFLPGRKLFQMEVTGLNSVGFSETPEGARSGQKGPTFKDTVSLVKGNHSLSMGGEITRLFIHSLESSNGFNGDYLFNSLANFLVSTPESLAASLPGGDDPLRQLHQVKFGSFFQDNYRVRPSLTLNLGLRYEFVTVPTEQDGKQSALVHFTDSAVTVGKFYENATMKSFSPRFGFAWAPGSHKTSLRGGYGIFYDHPGLLIIRTTISSLPPFSLSGSATAADAQQAGTTLRFPDAYATQLPLLRSTPLIRCVDYTQKPTYIHRWSLTVQREVGSNWVFSAGYTGSRALHLFVQTVPNANRWAGWPNQPTGPKFYPAITGTNRINPAWGDMRLQSPQSNSFHHDLAVSAQTRLRHGLTLQVAFTLSKTIDQASGHTSAGDALPQAQRNITGAWDINLDRGLAAFDIRKNFVTNFSYEVPLGANLTGVRKALLRGWQLNGILMVQSGYPFTILDSNSQQNTRIGVSGGLRADLIPGGNNNPTQGTSAGCARAGGGSATVAAGTKLGGPDMYYDPCQFALSQPGYYGNLGRDTLIAPGQMTFDSSVSKNFAVTERTRFQFRAEMFNLFNRANFGLPNATPWSSSRVPNINAGRVTSTKTSARQIQFGLKFIF